MYLKSLDINGFKSFAEKTNIQLSEPEISGSTVGIKITFDDNINAFDISEKLASGTPSIWARGSDSHSLIFRMGTINEKDIKVDMSERQFAQHLNDRIFLLALTSSKKVLS